MAPGSKGNGFLDFSLEQGYKMKVYMSLYRGQTGEICEKQEKFFYCSKFDT